MTTEQPLIACPIGNATSLMSEVRDEGPPLIDYVTERKGELRK